MTSDPDHVRDEEIRTVRGDEPAGAASEDPDTTDQAEAEAALSGAGVMMDSRDTGTIDRTDVGDGGDAADESDR
jgi:hypothetical protein